MPTIDVIGDIHGYADKLRLLLARLGYEQSGGSAIAEAWLTQKSVSLSINGSRKPFEFVGIYSIPMLFATLARPVDSNRIWIRLEVPVALILDLGFLAFSWRQPSAPGLAMPMSHYSRVL
jgi:hypothetical protein